MSWLKLARQCPPLVVQCTVQGAGKEREIKWGGKFDERNFSPNFREAKDEKWCFFGENGGSLPSLAAKRGVMDKTPVAKKGVIQDPKRVSRIFVRSSKFLLLNWIFLACICTYVCPEASPRPIFLLLLSIRILVYERGGGQESANPVFLLGRRMMRKWDRETEEKKSRGN